MGHGPIFCTLVFIFPIVSMNWTGLVARLQLITCPKVMIYGDSRSQSWPTSCVLVFTLSKELSDKEATSITATYEYRNCFAATCTPSFPTTKSLGVRTVSFDKQPTHVKHRVLIRLPPEITLNIGLSFQFVAFVIATRTAGMNTEAACGASVHVNEGP
jgi:hypothetical protein